MSEVSPRSALTAAGIEVCNRGLVREENQDNVRKASLPIGELFIVADGIGGYQGGAIASQMVVDGFHSQLAIKPPNYPPEDALQEACTYTNNSIHTKAGSGDPATQRMGSTVVLALIQTGGAVPMAFVGHVGDSRAYLIRSNRMSKITSDHSAVQALLSRNLITEEEARNHPDASVLTRSLGHRPEVEIEIDHVPLQAGDALLLCSDGLWGYVAEGDIEAVVTNPSLSMETVGDLLLRLALDAGGQDNIGIQYIRISGTAPGVSAPLHAAYPGNGAPVVSSAALAESHKTHRARNLQLAAIGLLLLAGVGALGRAYVKHTFPFPPKGDGSQKGQTTTSKETDKLVVLSDATPKTVFEAPEPALKWDATFRQFEKPDTCPQPEPGPIRIYHAKSFDKMESLLKQLEVQYPDDIRFKKPALHTETMTAKIMKDCGVDGFDLVVIVARTAKSAEQSTAPGKPPVLPRPVTPPPASAASRAKTDANPHAH